MISGVLIVYMHGYRIDWIIFFILIVSPCFISAYVVRRYMKKRVRRREDC